MKDKLLIVDDEKIILRSLKFLLEDYYDIYTSDNYAEAVDIFKNEKISLVLLDLRIKEDSGLDLMKEILKIDAEAIIIIMTAYSTIDNSIDAIKSGAYYFITKPIQNEQLLLLLKTAAEKLKMAEKIVSLEGHIKKELIGESEKIKEITTTINKVKDTDATILITGESGTGKELIAQKIHTSSNRAEKPFSAINCAALPGELLESELFGYKKGAFTGAYKDETGIIRKADQGTLFLDEIGEMDLKLQSKLLRFLQEKEIRQIGNDKIYKVDVRVICATNKNLKKEVEMGNFREDLYYRINVINFVSPPLRERIDDLKLLIPYFIDKYNISFNKNIIGMTDEAYNLLKSCKFEGNVRELENIIQRAVLLNTGDYIEADSLELISQKLNKVYGDNIEKYIKIYEGENFKDIEKKVIRFALDNNNQNRKWTADSLGISERSIRYKIKEYNL
ncbi:MAG: atoC1 [Bacillota bacterium]|jgi:DNA-binding NtrC family response regulator|nr:atoC1 [Bacillota bacterium]